MKVRELTKLEPRTADRILAAELALFCAFAVASLVRGEPRVAALSCVLFGIFLLRRLWKGPMVGVVIVQMGEEHLIFNDAAFLGKMQFALGDVAEIRIVGPISDRRIRVRSKTGKAKESFRGLSGKHLARIVSFLRENLPPNITLIEDEPPSAFAAIRGDF